MAQYNLIQKGEFQTKLTRALGIKERSPAPILASEVSAAVILADLSASDLWTNNEEPPRWTVRLNQALLAGSFTLGTISVPANSQYIVRILESTSLLSGSNTHQWGYMDIAFIPGTAASPFPHDLRNISSIYQPTCRVGLDAVSRIQFVMGHYTTQTAEPTAIYKPVSPLLVLPGQAFVIQHAASGSGLDCVTTFEVIPAI